MIYFKDVLEVGDLSLDKILFEFEKTPMIFVCRDRKRRYYFCLCTDMILDYTWMLTEVTRGLLLKVLCDEISILDVFKMSGNEIIIASQQEEIMSYEKKRFWEMSEEDLPEENEKLENPYLADYRKRIQNEIFKITFVYQYEAGVSISLEDNVNSNTGVRMREYVRRFEEYHLRKMVKEAGRTESHSMNKKFIHINKCRTHLIKDENDNIYYLDRKNCDMGKYKRRNFKLQEKLISMESAGI